MRYVYIGSNAAGKTRASIKLARQFENEGLIVVSNLPEFNSDSIPADSQKEKAIQEWYYYLNKGEQSTIEKVNIDKIVELICKKGDVLLLDDIDSNISSETLFTIVEMLRIDEEDENDSNLDFYPVIHQLWKHVIITGNNEMITHLTAKDWLEREAYLVNRDGTLNKLIGGDEIERVLYEIRNLVTDSI